MLKSEKAPARRSHVKFSSYGWIHMFSHKNLHNYYVTSISPLTLQMYGLLDLAVCLELVSSYTVHSFIVPYSWFSCGCRMRKQMQRKDSFILPALWEMGMWRLARLMYLTQWKPRAGTYENHLPGRPGASLIYGVFAGWSSVPGSQQRHQKQQL